MKATSTVATRLRSTLTSETQFNFILTGTKLPIFSSTSQSGIGVAFLARPRTAVASAALFIAADVLCVVQGAFGEVRACLALIAFAVTVSLSNGDHLSLGLRASPVQGWTPWIRTSMKIAVAVAVCVAVGLGSLAAMGHQLNLPVTHPSQMWPRFVHMCVLAPTIEETFYRFVACGLIAAVVGNNLTIAINGVLFGYLHILYGNPSPENLVGGFFLAWSFLKSETFLLPVLLHSMGNLLVLMGQVAGWYMSGGAG